MTKKPTLLDVKDGCIIFLDNNDMSYKEANLCASNLPEICIMMKKRNNGGRFSKE